MNRTGNVEFNANQNQNSGWLFSARATEWRGLGIIGVNTETQSEELNHLKGLEASQKINLKALVNVYAI